MTPRRDALLTAVAVLAGLSPLLWVTGQEYGLQRAELRAAAGREAVLVRAQALAGRGEIDGAIDVLLDAAERSPDDPRYGHALAALLLRSGHLVRSREQLDRIRSVYERSESASGP